MTEDKNIHIAHSATDERKAQLLITHLQNVADLARQFAEPFESSAAAAWLGWWHDVGKIAPDVQAYLHGRTKLKKGPDHSSAGMLEAAEKLSMLAFNIAGHHGGLVNTEALKQRIAAKIQESRVVEARKAGAALVQDSCSDPSPDWLPEHLRNPVSKDDYRKLEFWIRMMHSALVDADCLDTEEHFQPEKASLRHTKYDSISALWARLSARLDGLMTGASDTSVNRVRKELYIEAIGNATREAGVYSLTIPTGGGKTLTSMGFALRHAAANGQRRVIVALPYTSIIDQNAAVYRGFLGDANVIEHHSNLSLPEEAGEESEEERRARLSAENWDAPVIVTTTVQLLESLFSNRNSRLRKLHRIAGSVIILDEVQTLKPGLLEPTLEVMQHLVDYYRVTIVLCTATQPALSRSEILPGGLHPVNDLIAGPAKYFTELRRVRYEWVLEPWTQERVAQALRRVEQGLVIVNTVGDAIKIIEWLGESPHAFHLSTSLCAAHRRAVLQVVRERLASGLPVRVVSTQVIEAGVDIDFPTVFRAVGPLDRIIQAAGRCNREGGLSQGTVYIFELEGGKSPPGEYRTATDTTRRLLREDSRIDLHDPRASHRFFELYYHASPTDEHNIQAQRTELNFATTADRYRLIPEESIPVVVPYDGSGGGERTRILKRIAGQGYADHQDFRRLQPYVVGLRSYAHKKALHDGLCYEWVPGVWMWKGRYHKKTGLSTEIVDMDPFMI